MLFIVDDPIKYFICRVDFLLVVQVQLTEYVVVRPGLLGASLPLLLFAVCRGGRLVLVLGCGDALVVLQVLDVLVRRDVRGLRRRLRRGGLKNRGKGILKSMCTLICSQPPY